VCSNFLFGHSLSLLMNHSDCGFFKLMYTWVLPDNKKKFKIFARAYSKYFQRIYFSSQKKGTFKSLRMFSIYGFYGILGFKKQYSRIFTVPDSVLMIQSVFRLLKPSRILAFSFFTRIRSFFFADSRISTSLVIYL